MPSSKSSTFSTDDIRKKFPNESKDFSSTLLEDSSSKESRTAIQKSAPIAGFVATSVLTSSDGLFGDKVEESRIAAENTSVTAQTNYKPVYEQLQEQKEKRDAEWKAKNNPFAPPKALDEDEVDFLNAMDTQQKQKARQLEQQSKEDLAEFVMARAQRATNSLNIQTKKRQLPSEKVENPKAKLKSSSAVNTVIKVMKAKKGKRIKRGGAVHVKTNTPLVPYNSGSSSEDET